MTSLSAGKLAARKGMIIGLAIGESSPSAKINMPTPRLSADSIGRVLRVFAIDASRPRATLNECAREGISFLRDAHETARAEGSLIEFAPGDCRPRCRRRRRRRRYSSSSQS